MPLTRNAVLPVFALGWAGFSRAKVVVGDLSGLCADSGWIQGRFARSPKANPVRLWGSSLIPHVCAITDIYMWQT